ncbi:MAG: amidohydrolase [Candidatus Tectomicrobia bacterium]|nr:amidohydrolase [Candidatus Tectomicrobia bacterium]
MAMTMDFEIYLAQGSEYGPKELLALEDEAGIEMAIVMPSPIFRPLNKWVAEQLKGHPRLIPCCQVNPHFGEEAVKEFETAVKEWGMKGLKLMATLHGYQIESPMVYPLMEKARELKVPVNIHSGTHGCEPLQIGELAARYPDVPIIMDHMGYRSYVGQAIAAAKRCENILLGTTIVSYEPIQVRRAVDEVGADRVVFGSNAPSCFPVYAVQSLKRMKFTSEQEELIFGKNLARLYGIQK